MQKRDFDYLSEYTAVTIALPAAKCCNSQLMDFETQPFFFSHAADVNTITETGKAYRQQHSEEDNKKKLAELLLSDSMLADSSDIHAIRNMLDNKVNTDFKTGNTAEITGWVLSLTEARECALFSILNPS
ncbi:MAG: hypothetical protein JWP94_956 [Mucilaginibacter sp.]|jgi:hypothetical protein|nr:hypothetical protein [Mucilaginibacter sp.]